MGGEDVVLGVAASALFLAPRALEWGAGPSQCAPCDPRGVPGFDRWAITPVDASWRDASMVGLVGLAGAAALDLGRRRGGIVRGAAVLESGLAAVAVAELIKAAVGRRRPVLYTDAAPEAVSSRETRRSFPSGHTAGAVAIATSYWLSHRALRGDQDRGWRWAAVGAAVAVGVMRVAAGKHFPSDVVAGAAVGISTTLLVHTIRF